MREVYKTIIAWRFPRLAGGFGWVDGCRWPIDRPADYVEQNAYYNGWTSNHCIGISLLLSNINDLISRSYIIES